MAEPTKEYRQYYCFTLQSGYGFSSVIIKSTSNEQAARTFIEILDRNRKDAENKKSSLEYDLGNNLPVDGTLKYTVINGCDCIFVNFWE